MEGRIAPQYLRDLALLVGNQAVTAEEMREIARALLAASEQIEEEAASRVALLEVISSLRSRQ